MAVSVPGGFEVSSGRFRFFFKKKKIVKKIFKFFWPNRPWTSIELWIVGSIHDFNFLNPNRNRILIDSDPNFKTVNSIPIFWSRFRSDLAIRTGPWSGLYICIHIYEFSTLIQCLVQEKEKGQKLCEQKNYFFPLFSSFGRKKK